MNTISKKLRLKALSVAKRVGAIHVGGIFSSLEFIYSFYKFSLENDKKELKFIISKGHCYLAQLIVLEELGIEKNICNSYLLEGTSFFGHPKRVSNNSNFIVSAGALGQGITMGNGIAFAQKIKKSKIQTWTLIGDGELNEGSCNEAFLFAAQHNLNHIFVLDNNKQESLDLTEEIQTNGDIKSRIESYGIQYKSIEGHNIFEIMRIIDYLSNKSGPFFLDLQTIKGKGVSFMEGNPIWHSRRFKNNELPDAIQELSGENFEE